MFNRYDVGSENFCRGNVIKKSTKAQGIDFVHDSTVLGLSCWEGAKTFSLALKRFERSKRGELKEEVRSFKSLKLCLRGEGMWEFWGKQFCLDL